MELRHDTAAAPTLERKRGNRLFTLAFAASLGLHLAAGAAFLQRTPSSGVAAGSQEAISVSLVASKVLDAAEEQAAVQEEAAASTPVEGTETGERQAKTEKAERSPEETHDELPPPETKPEAPEAEPEASPVPPVLSRRDETPDAVPLPARRQAEKPRVKPRSKTKPAPDPKPQGKNHHRAKKALSRRRQAATSGRGAGAKSGRVSASRGSLTSYIGMLRARLARHKPDGVTARGTAKVAFAISASGRLIYARLSHSSGSAALDVAAVRAVRAAAPFPPPPGGQTFRTVIPFKSR